MRPIKILWGLVLLAVLPSASAECPHDSLRLAVIPKKEMAVLIHDYKPLLRRLSRELGMPVQMVPMASYDSAIDAIVSGGVDVAWLGPASYVLAHQRDPRIEPFASLTIDRGRFTPAGHHYQALLLTRIEGPATIGALRGGSVALSDPVSTSGSLVPTHEFPKIVGMPLQRFFGSIVYSGSHDNSLDALLEGRVEAAFVASVRADAYINTGRMTGESLRALWRSERIYYDPYVFRGGLCSSFKDRIRNVMMSDPQGLAEFLASQHASGIAPVTHGDYAPLLRMLNAQGAASARQRR